MRFVSGGHLRTKQLPLLCHSLPMRAHLTLYVAVVCILHVRRSRCNGSLVHPAALRQPHGCQSQPQSSNRHLWLTNDICLLLDTCAATCLQPKAEYCSAPLQTRLPEALLTARRSLWSDMEDRTPADDVEAASQEPDAETSQDRSGTASTVQTASTSGREAEDPLVMLIIGEQAAGICELQTW